MQQASMLPEAQDADYRLPVKTFIAPNHSNTTRKQEVSRYGEWSWQTIGTPANLEAILGDSVLFDWLFPLQLTPWICLAYQLTDGWLSILSNSQSAARTDI